MADVALWLQTLSDEEQARIRPVLERDLDFQKRERARLRSLRSHVELSKARSLSRLSYKSTESDEPVSPTGRQCALCCIPLGFVLNSGAECPGCRQRVCVTCRRKTRNSWLCPMCYTEREYVAASGEWFQRKSSEPPSISEILLLELQRTAHAKQTSSSRTTTIEGEYNTAKMRKNAPNHQGKRPLSLQPFTDTSARHRHRSKSRQKSIDEDIESQTNHSRRSTNSMIGYETPPPDTPKTVIPTLTIENFDRPLSTDSEDVYASQTSSNSSSTYHSSQSSSNLKTELTRTRTSLTTAIKAYSTGQLPNQSRSARKRTKEELSLQAPSSNRAISDPNIPKFTFASSNGQVDKTTKESKKKISTATTATTGSFDSLDTISLYSDTSKKSSMKSSMRGSMSSLAGAGTIQGDVLLKLHYNCRQGALEVYIDRCRNLIESKRHRPNPYVKLYLYPSESEEEEKRKSKTKRHTIEPLFDEVLRYPGVTKSELDKRSLFVSVWHNDFFGRNSFLGEVRIDLADYPWHLDDIFCYPLGPKQDRDPPDPMQPPENKRGTLRFSLKFTPPDTKSNDLKKQKSGSITCTIILAHAAVGHPPEKANSPFVKGRLFLDEKHSIRLKTPVAKPADNQDPTWNHNFQFQGQLLTDLPNRSLQLTVYDQQGLTSRRFLGQVRLNNPAHSSGPLAVSDGCKCLECDVWRKMIAHPNSWIDTELALRG